MRLRSALADVVLMAAIGLCLVAAAGYGLSSLYHVLRHLVGPAAASALMAALLAVVALGLALWRSELRRRTPAVLPAAAPVAPAPPEPVAPAPEMAPADMATSAAFLAGFLLVRRLF